MKTPNLPLCLIALPLLMLLACTPGLIFENAEVTRGFSGGLGADFGYNTYVIAKDYGPLPDITPSPEGTLDARYGFNDQWSIFGRLSLGYHFWAPPPIPSDWTQQTRWSGEFQIGTKVRIHYPGEGALRLAIGFPNIVDIKYLWDLNPDWTLNAGASFFRGLSFGATWHIPVSSLATCHVAGEVSFPPSACLGVAFGFPQ